MSAAFELAKKYYPRLWDKSRLDALVKAGKLSEAERDEIVKEASGNGENG